MRTLTRYELNQRALFFSPEVHDMSSQRNSWPAEQMAAHTRAGAYTPSKAYAVGGAAGTARTWRHSGTPALPGGTRLPYTSTGCSGTEHE